MNRLVPIPYPVPYNWNCYSVIAQNVRFFSFCTFVGRSSVIQQQNLKINHQVRLVKMSPRLQNLINNGISTVYSKIKTQQYAIGKSPIQNKLRKIIITY